MPTHPHESQYRCESCEYTASEHHFPYAKNLSLRLSPGAPYTDRECPKHDCGALAYPVASPPQQPPSSVQAGPPLTRDTVMTALTLALEAMQEDPELEEVDTLSLMEEAIHHATDFLTTSLPPPHSSQHTALYVT